MNKNMPVGQERPPLEGAPMAHGKEGKTTEKEVTQSAAAPATQTTAKKKTSNAGDTAQPATAIPPAGAGAKSHAAAVPAEKEVESKAAEAVPTAAPGGTGQDVPQPAQPAAPGQATSQAQPAALAAPLQGNPPGNVAAQSVPVQPYPPYTAGPGYAPYPYLPPAGAPPGAAGVPQTPPNGVYNYAYGGYIYTPPAPKAKEPFNTTRADAWFALACAVLGFLFMRWLVFAGMQGWGVTAFTVLFAASVLCYCFAKKVKPSKASWFWLGILVLTGGAYALWPAGSMAGWQGLLLFAAAVYWCGSLFGALMAGKTSNYLLLDVTNLFFVVPFRNYGAIPYSLKAFGNGASEQKAKRNKRVLYVLAGLLICLMLLPILLNQLLAADEGGFNQLLQGFFDLLRRIFSDNIWLYTVQFVLGVPVAFYLCGLVAGSGHKRYIGAFSAKKTDQVVAQLRLVPLTTIATVLVAVSALYVVFIASQIPYFFSAFAGIKPVQYAVYSEYAREGFFELCRIAAINLGLLALSNVFSRTARAASKPLRAANIALCALTLLLIATAYSKMGLYISAQGLTPKRVMTCVFMTFLAGVCVAVIVLQFRKFSILRFAAGFGAVLLCALCLCNLDGLVLRYNAARYLNGSLPSFDTVIVERSLPNGIFTVLEVYEQEEDAAVKTELGAVINRGYRIAQYDMEHPGSRDNLLYARIRAEGRLPLPEAEEEDGYRM